MNCINLTNQEPCGGGCDDCTQASISVTEHQTLLAELAVQQAAAKLDPQGYTKTLPWSEYVKMRDLAKSVVEDA